MADTSNQPRIARTSAAIARPARLEALTLRCERDVRQRIEAAFEHERGARPRLSLGRFLAECATNGLPGNLPSARETGADADAVASAVASRIADRLAGVEGAIPLLADVLGNLTEKLLAIERALDETRTDAGRVRELIEGAVDADTAGAEGNRK